MTKKITLCADDYGLSETVNLAILELVELKRLTAVSCMTNMPDWLKSAKRIASFKQQIQLGLHLNLTEGKALTGASSLTKANGHFLSLEQLIRKAFFRLIKQEDVIREFHAQLNAFDWGLQCSPDFIDGHQHVHHLPIIRDAILTVYEQRLQEKNPYIRSVAMSWLRTFKAADSKKIAIIQLTGAKTFKRILKRYDIPHNPAFSGFYNFDHQLNYQTLFQSFVKALPNNGLIMCHPGLNNPKDSIGAARFNEYNYLASEKFLIDCNKLHITITR